jgi:hypothetical protein
MEAVVAGSLAACARLLRAAAAAREEAARRAYEEALARQKEGYERQLALERRKMQERMDVTLSVQSQRHRSAAQANSAQIRGAARTEAEELAAQRQPLADLFHATKGPQVGARMGANMQLAWRGRALRAGRLAPAAASQHGTLTHCPCCAMCCRRPGTAAASCWRPCRSGRARPAGWTTPCPSASGTA